MNRNDAKTQLLIDFVAGYIDNTGYSPTLAEIGAAFGWSKTCVAHHVDKATRQGLLTHRRNSPRTLRPAPPQEA